MSTDNSDVWDDRVQCALGALESMKIDEMTRAAAGGGRAVCVVVRSRRSAL